MNRRWRLHTRWTLTLAVSVLLVVLGYGTTLYLLVRNDRLAAVDAALQQETKRLAGLVKIGKKGIEVESHDHLTVSPAGPPIYSLVADAAGSILERFPSEEGPTPALKLALPNRGFAEHHYHMVSLDGRPYRVVELRLQGTREHYEKKTYEFIQLHGEATLAAWQDLSGVEADLTALWQRIGLLGLVTVVAAALLGYFLAGRMLRPISELVRHAEQIEDLSERLPLGPARDELARLAEVINAMLARLESVGTWERRFLADAAHEFRSPLTVLQGEIELSLRRPRDAAAYHTVLRTCQAEIHGLSRLVEGLLFLARADAGTLQEPRELVDLRDVVSESLRQGQSVAGERLRGDCPDDNEPAPVWGNGALLHRLVMNLVENAIEHGGPQAEIELALRRANGQTVLCVQDNGPGIAPDDLPHIFERFYRGDRSRSRANGRVGLGLAIARAIAVLHGGQIIASIRMEGGAKFEVTLPTAVLTEEQALSPTPRTLRADSPDQQPMASCPTAG
jgi:signal transduction histidine kinase